jgi:hypothetical protein
MKDTDKDIDNIDPFIKFTDESLIKGTFGFFVDYFT